MQAKNVLFEFKFSFKNEFIIAEQNLYTIKAAFISKNELRFVFGKGRRENTKEEK